MSLGILSACGSGYHIQELEWQMVVSHDVGPGSMWWDLNNLYGLLFICSFFYGVMQKS